MGSPGKPGKARTDGTVRTYDAGAAAAVPALTDIPGVDQAADPVPDRFEAVYFDTPGLVLAARRISLHRLTGGTGEGWHLVLPAAEAGEQELRAPLGRPDAVPQELLDQVLVYTRGRELCPVARISTQRATCRLYGPGGEHLADFSDDEIHAETLHPLRSARRWREWEIKLVRGAGSLLAAAEKILAPAGARRCAHGAGPARALGGAWPPALAAGTGRPRKKGPAADVVAAYLDERIREFFTHDPGVRRQAPDAVHQMRSATRRARSALATYRRLFDKAAVTSLADDLKWLARILGRARDAEVMQERLRQHPGGRSGKAGPASLPGPLAQELAARYDAGYQEVLAALGSGRYYRLLDSLERFRDHPPARALASRPARKVTARLVGKSARRLGRARKAARQAAAGPARDTALHQVRKDAKRLRHAAESVAVIHGKRAAKLAGAAKGLQQILGDHQDSVMARTLLARLAAAPGLPPDTAGAYARLLAAEERTSRETEAQYRKASRKKALKIRLRR